MPFKAAIGKSGSLSNPWFEKPDDVASEANMRRIFAVAIVLCSSFILIVALHSQCAPGLHAGIEAVLLPMESGPNVQLSFLLLNDSGTDIALKPESWKIVINGKELEDSEMIFDKGFASVKGLPPLLPGQSAAFMEFLPTKQYFPHPGKYTLSWKGDGFESSSITITIPAK